MMPPEAMKHDIDGHVCTIQDGTITQGSDLLRGRSVDDLLDCRHLGPKANGTTAHPYQQQDDWHVVYGNPWEGANSTMRFQDQESAVLTQHYLDEGDNRYYWEEKPDSLNIYKKRPDARFAADAQQETLAASRGCEKMVGCPNTHAGRKVAEKAWRSVIKGQMHHKLKKPPILNYGFHPMLGAVATQPPPGVVQPPGGRGTVSTAPTSAPYPSGGPAGSTLGSGGPTY